ncbi:biotin--[acetyl-CoA-carboxylase] ligase [Synechocystis sp. LKSZ1]|uniref:biotin--[acetyl-CoA-carboxylase] ligase n=1 Tax=Synechocystis sp. LKSZ1 TaxID=3144951 RepID=UPI00336BC5CE
MGEFTTLFLPKNTENASCMAGDDLLSFCLTAKELAEIRAQSWPNLTVQSFETLPSTNQRAWELQQAGIQPPLLVLAQQQSAGQGQWGRVWQSEPGGLYLSLLLAVDLPVQQAAIVTLWSAWGIATALNDQGIPVGLKWPNDLVLAGRKLGGIKGESHIERERITQVVIGVGLNWRNPVPATGIQLQAWLQENKRDDVTNLGALLGFTLQGLARGYRTYQTQGVEAILAGYHHYFLNLGQIVSLEQGQGRVTGVSAQGELLVEVRSPGAMSRLALPPGAVSLGYAFPPRPAEDRV